MVVSGDLIEDTITAKLLDRVRPGLIDDRRSQAGSLPTVDTFAAGITAAALMSDPEPLVLVGKTRDAHTDTSR